MDYHNHMNKSSSQNFQFIFLYLLICIVFFKSGSLEAQDFGSESQSKEILVETIKDWISKKENVEMESITIFADDRRFKVPPCKNNFSVQYAFGTKNTVTTACEETNWKASIRVRVDVSRNALVYESDFKVGHVITTADLIEVEIDNTIRSVVSKNYSDQSNDFVGKMLKVNVNNGQILDKNHFEENTIVYVARSFIPENTVITEDYIIAESAANSIVSINERFEKNTMLGKTTRKNIEKGERLNLASFSAIYQAVVVNKIVERGQKLDANNSSVLEVFEKPTPNTVTDKSMIERAITIRRLLPGSVVRFSDLHVSPHVSKGTTATLYFTMEKLSVRLEVIVMEDGYIGDTVKVRNEESGEEMFATVTDEGKVAIN